jgi:hypothetical protein
MVMIASIRYVVPRFARQYEVFRSFPQRLAMERYFMTRTSAVALLVGSCRALRDELRDKPAHEATRSERMLKNIERMLLDVRAGRAYQFDLEYPSTVRVIVSD